MCQNFPTELQPVKALLKKDAIWLWTEVHEQALDRVKCKLAIAPALAYYDPEKPTKVSADVISFGIGVDFMVMHYMQSHSFPEPSLKWSADTPKSTSSAWQTKHLNRIIQK